MNDSIETARTEWIVIPAPHFRTAETFYSEVFGFSISPHSKTFLVFKTGNLSGAVDRDLAPSAKGVSFSLTVQDSGETLRHIREFAGDVVREKDELVSGADTRPFAWRRGLFCDRAAASLIPFGFC